MKAFPLSVALLHHPVYDKNRDVVTTSFTNLDIHDISRSARTFGLSRFFLATPVEEQRLLALRIAEHWRHGWGATYNPRRKEALELVEVVASLEDARRSLESLHRLPVRLVATGARVTPTISYEELAARLDAPVSESYLIVLGTGWGLADDVIKQCDIVLPPLRGAGEYNHLSVRSAAAIMLDRLCSRGR